MCFRVLHICFLMLGNKPLTPLRLRVTTFITLFDQASLHAASLPSLQNRSLRLRLSVCLRLSASAEGAVRRGGRSVTITTCSLGVSFLPVELGRAVATSRLALTGQKWPIRAERKNGICKLAFRQFMARKLNSFIC